MDELVEMNIVLGVCLYEVIFDLTSINRKSFKNRMNKQWDLTFHVLNSAANYTCKKIQIATNMGQRD